MGHAGHIVGGLLLALAVFGILYTLAASILIERFKATRVASEAGRPAGTVTWPAVSLLKPLHGDEPGLRGNLESFLRQDYPGQVQMVLGLQDAADPALELARDLAARFPDQVTVVLDPQQHGANRKVSNLVNLTRAARHDVLVQSDSDISVDPAYLRRVVTALHADKVGLVTALYLGQGGAGPWSRLAAMNLSYGFLPNVAVGVGLGLAKPCMGSTIALRRETLGTIGGWQAVADVLADDFEIGRAVRAAGLKTVVAPGAVVHTCSERSLPELWRHELRWARTVRQIDPGGFAGSLVTHPIPLALLALLAGGASAVGGAVLAGALISRLWLTFRVDRAFGGSAGAWWMTPIRDMLSFSVFIAAFLGRSIEWRGSRYQVAKTGVLASSRPPAGQDC